MDLRKAFDSIWHTGLFLKLLQNNIGGQFYSIIKNLYSKSECAIKIGNRRTNYFNYSRGVRQGCVLSPLLFNIYVNNFPFKIAHSQFDPFLLPDGTNLNCLLYADDLVIFSQTQRGLQLCLNELEDFCDSNLLEVNLKKTKIMIFQKNASRNKNLHFFYKKKEIEVVKDYNYLGVKMTSTGNFIQTQEMFKEKANRAVFAMRKYVDFSRLPTKLTF